MQKDIRKVKSKKKIVSTVLAILLPLFLSVVVLGGLYKVGVFNFISEPPTSNTPEEPEEPLIPDSIFYASYLEAFPTETIIEVDKRIEGSYIFCDYHLTVSVNDILDLKEHEAYSYFDLESLINNGYSVHGSYAWADDSDYYIYGNPNNYIEWIPDESTPWNANRISNYSNYKILNSFTDEIRISLHFINYSRTYSVITHSFYISINEED